MMGLFLTILFILFVMSFASYVAEKEKIDNQLSNYFDKRKNKIYKELPKYHPISGQPFEWKISFKRKIIGYDVKTGEPKYKGKEKVYIQQLPPQQMVDENAYCFDWYNKKIQKLGYIWR